MDREGRLNGRFLAATGIINHICTDGSLINVSSYKIWGVTLPGVEMHIIPKMLVVTPTK